MVFAIFSIRYMDTLENQLLPSVELFYNPEDYWIIFQQDGASAHTAHSIRDYFKEKNIEVLPWRPRSPDLSPIENLWSFMDAKLVNTRITSIDHIKQVLHNILAIDYYKSKNHLKLLFSLFNLIYRMKQYFKKLLSYLF